MNPKAPLPPANGVHTSSLVTDAKPVPSPDPRASVKPVSADYLSFHLKCGVTVKLKAGTILYDRPEQDGYASANRVGVVLPVSAISGHSDEAGGRAAFLTADIAFVTIDDERATELARTNYAAFLGAFYKIPDSVPTASGF